MWNKAPTCGYCLLWAVILIQMTKILNTWKSTPERKEYYELNDPIYKNGDWTAFSQWNGSIIYAYKNVAINNLTGLNTEHIDRLANNQRPDGEFNQNHFLFDRAMENREVGLSLL